MPNILLKNDVTENNNWKQCNSWKGEKQPQTWVLKEPRKHLNVKALKFSEQSRKFSQKNEKFIENIVAEIFRVFEGLTNCYFQLKNI